MKKIETEIPSPTSAFDATRSYSKKSFILFSIISLAIIGSVFSISNESGQASAKKTKAAATTCSLRVAFLLDRSSSIGAWQVGGSVSDVNDMKAAAVALVGDIEGPNSYIQTIAFASWTQDITPGGSGWWHLDGSSTVGGVTQTNTWWQSFAIFGHTFKTDSNTDTYSDGLTALNEGLTNWESALIAADNMNPAPTHVVVFTDGYPTTRHGNTIDAINRGGWYIGLENFDADGQDYALALNAATSLRNKGAVIIPVGVGDIDGSKMSGLANGGAWFNAGAFGNLSALEGAMHDASAEINNNCTTTTTTTTTTPPPTPVEAHIELTSSHNNIEILEGETLNLTLSAKNTGTVKLDGVKIITYQGDITCPAPDDGAPYQHPGFLEPTITASTVFSIPTALGITEDPIIKTVCAYGTGSANANQVIVGNASVTDRIVLEFPIKRIPLPN